MTLNVEVEVRVYFHLIWLWKRLDSIWQN